MNELFESRIIVNISSHPFHHATLILEYISMKFFGTANDAHAQLFMVMIAGKQKDCLAISYIY